MNRELTPQAENQVYIFDYLTTSSFATWQEAIRFMHEKDKLNNDLNECIAYNVVLRDKLRQYGIEALLEEIFAIIPRNTLTDLTLRYIHRYWQEEPIADYDIQMYSINDAITILGHTFHGLADIRAHREIVGKLGSRWTDCWPKACEPINDVHIGEWYANYPVFDSSDYSDNRTYENYIFRTHPLTQEHMNEYLQIPHSCNYSMVGEGIPQTLLPILYYPGDGPYMLLATAKQKD